ncbi:hypothetical protein N7501_006235 [Penicillium viridicatum]|nr:hypothetical protein N7501_006235 [Penicillium viridicatum]
MPVFVVHEERALAAEEAAQNYLKVGSLEPILFNFMCTFVASLFCAIHSPAQMEIRVPVLCRTNSMARSFAVFSCYGKCFEHWEQHAGLRQISGFTRSAAFVYEELHTPS